jgi:hypothetical protein
MRLNQLLLKYDRKNMAQNSSSVDPLKLEVFSGMRVDPKKNDKKKKKKAEFEFK